MKANIYPTEELWRTDLADEDYLKIINEGDFPKGDILDGLGLTNSGLRESFGIKDPVEIQNRLALCEFLLKTPTFRRMVSDIRGSGIPDSGSSFLDYFDPDRIHNPHWEQVHEFRDRIAKVRAPLPRRLLKVIEALNNSMDLEKVERKLGAEVSKLLERSTVIEGHVTYPLRLDGHNRVHMIPDEKKLRNKVLHVHGHRHHSATLSRVKDRDYKSWSGWKEMWTLGINWLAQNAIAMGAKCFRRCSMKTMVIDNIEDRKMEEVRQAVEAKIKKIKIESHIDKLPREIEEAYVDVYFCYGQEGLQIRIDAIRVVSNDRNTENGLLRCSTFDGYSAKRAIMIENMRKEVMIHQRNASQLLLIGTLYKGIIEKDPKFFDIEKHESPRMDEAFKWFAVSKAMKAGDFKARFEEIAKHRKFFYDNLFILRELCAALESMKRKARSIGTKLCIPKILPGPKQTVIMNGIYPIHLFSRKDVKPQPIQGISEINGGMVALTGENAAGKSVTELSLTDNIWLAQSGLPVFGNSFSLTVKDAIGLVFVERGDGSTCQLLMIKITKILKYLKGNRDSDTLIILDELGGNTSEGDFIALGKRILRSLHVSSASVIFSTQIRILAEYARDDLGTRCLQIERGSRQILAGIGDANPGGLADEVGLTAFLED